MQDRGLRWLVAVIGIAACGDNLHAPPPDQNPLGSTADIMEQVLEMALEGVDGATVADLAVPGAPPKQLLLHLSMNDAQVPNLATLFQARSLGRTRVTPTVAVLFGFESAQATIAERGLVIVDQHPTPVPPSTNLVFAADNDAHENPRRRAAIQQMMRDFWTTGAIGNTCTGACDCAAGNCGALRMPQYGGN